MWNLTTKETPYLIRGNIYGLRGGTRDELGGGISGKLMPGTSVTPRLSLMRDNLSGIGSRPVFIVVKFTLIIDAVRLLKNTLYIEFL